jgi:anti-sigma B factor antagonist
MKIDERTLDDIILLDLSGRFILGEDGEFKHRVATKIKSGSRKLIVNLAKVGHMDSSGLGELIAGYIAMQRVNGQIKLLHVNDRLNDLLITTKLITVFETFDSESAAISSFITELKGSDQ